MCRSKSEIHFLEQQFSNINSLQKKKEQQQIDFNAKKKSAYPACVKIDLSSTQATKSL